MLCFALPVLRAWLERESEPGLLCSVSHFVSARSLCRLVVALVFRLVFGLESS